MLQPIAENGISSLMKMELLMELNVLHYENNLSVKTAGWLILLESELKIIDMNKNQHNLIKFTIDCIIKNPDG